MTFHAPNPEEISVRYLAALARLGAGQSATAIDILRDILRRDPDHAGARRNLIRGLLAAGEHDAVIAETALAITRAPAAAELHFLRGTALNARSRSLEAREALTRAVALDPTRAPAWLNLGNALTDLDDLAGAERNCRHAIALDPTLIEAHVSLGFILTAQGRPTEAIAALEHAIRIEPANVQAHWNLATAALLAGDLRRGFTEYEWRKQHDLFRRDFINLPGPVWDGGDPNGQTILVHAEQGFGDTVQFARYLTLIARGGGRPVLACDPSLMRLLRTVDCVTAVSKLDPLPRYDAWIDQMSLPHVFDTTLETIPLGAGYLTADPALVAAHRANSPASRRIGLAWTGNPRHRNDRRRTPPPSVFQPLTSTRDLVSLVPDRELPGVACPTRRLSDYAETAALIMTLDMVITVDTSVAHVAGALGRPTWVLLPYAPDWRWMLKRNDTPWYDSVRLFRQPAPGDWGSVVAAVLAALAG